jgi:polar amino acid transport system substrate-binding protein
LSKYFGLTFRYLSIGVLLVPWLNYAPNADSQETESVFLSVYTEESFPLNYTDKQHKSGPIVGYATELIQAILEHAKIGFHIEMVPWRRAIQAIDSRENVIVYSMTRSPERENKYQWIGKVLPLDYYLYGLKSKFALLPKTIEEARALKIGIVRGDVTNDYLPAQGFNNLTNVSEPSRQLQMLKRGRIDLFPFNAQGIGPIIERNNFDTDDFIGILRLDSISTGVYLALSNQTSAAVFQRLQASYNAIVNSGQYDRIFLPFLEQNSRLKVLTIDNPR